MAPAKVSNLRHRPLAGSTPQVLRDTLEGLELMVANANASVYPAELAEWWSEIAELSLSLGKYENAMAAAQRAQGYVEILFDPSAYATLLNLQGTCLSQLGDERGAMIHFERALAQFPGLPTARFNLAVLCLADKQYQEASDSFSDLVRENPNDAESMNLLGVAHFHLGEMEKAERKFYLTTTIDRNYAAAYYHLSLIRLQQGDLKMAFTECSRAATLSPNEPSYWNNRGVIHARLGRLNEAVSDFTRAMTLDHGYVAAHLNRALALTDLGKKEYAEADVTRAVTIRSNALETLPAEDRIKLELFIQQPDLRAA